MHTPSSRRIILLIISLTMFMEAVDTTILNTALPAMSRSLAVNPIDLKIALISYLLSLAIFIPISGWIADKFGVKRVFIIALIVFTLSSMGCGLAHSLLALVIGRSLQGLGGSLTVPVARLIIVRTYERHELISATNRAVMIASIGPMLGPLLGGFITGHYSWRFIFWVNIPVGIILTILSFYKLENTPPRIMPKLDIMGFLFFGSGLAGLTFGLSAFSEDALSLAECSFIILASLLTLLLYSFHSRGKKNPVINIQLLHLRTFKTSILGNLMTRLGFGGLPFLLPLMLQIPLGYSPQLAGLLLAPTAIGTFVTKPFARVLLQKFGFKHLLIVNTALVSCSLASFSLIDQHTSLYLIALLTFTFGMLTTLQYSSMNPLAYADMPSENLHSATSIISTTQQLAQSFGVALSAMCLRYFSSPTVHSNLNILVFKDTFIVAGFITLLSTQVFFQLKPADGEKMIHKS